MKSKPKGRGIQSQWWKMPFSRGFLKKLDDIQTRVPPIPPALGSGEYKSCPPYYGKSLQGTFGAAGKETTALTVPCPQKAATKTPDRQGQMIFSCFFTWVLAHQLPPEQGMELCGHTHPNPTAHRSLGASLHMESKCHHTWTQQDNHSSCSRGGKQHVLENKLQFLHPPQSTMWFKESFA